MLRQLFVLGILLSVILVSGCTQTTPSGETGGGLTEKQIEDQAMQQIEQELDQAVQDLDLSDIENSIPE